MGGFNWDSSNFSSPIGAMGKPIQKATDPLSWVTGGKWADWTSDDIPKAANQVLNKVNAPAAAWDKMTNPIRQNIPIVDNVVSGIEKKPADALGLAAAAYFGAGALGAGAGGGGGAGAGAAGGGGVAAPFAGGSVPSAGLPGIFPGASVGTSTTGAGGLFGGSAGGLGAGLGVGSGSVAAPAITGGASMFAGGGNLSRDQAIRLLMQQYTNQQNNRANQYRSQIR